MFICTIINYVLTCVVTLYQCVYLCNVSCSYMCIFRVYLCTISICLSIYFTGFLPFISSAHLLLLSFLVTIIQFSLVENQQQLYPFESRNTAFRRPMRYNPK